MEKFINHYLQILLELLGKDKYLLDIATIIPIIRPYLSLSQLFKDGFFRKSSMHTLMRLWIF